MQDINERGLPSSTSDINELANMCTRMKDDIGRIRLELSTSRGRAVDEGRSNPPGLKRVVVLIDIDEDGAVFNLDLIANGIIGGRDAGLQLATGVRQYLGTDVGGYKTIFRTQITSGYKDKLVLLKTYGEDADRFAELDLPIFPIENLFTLDKIAIPEKLVTATPGILAVEIPNSQTPPGSPEEWTTVNRRKGRGRGPSLAGTPVLGLTLPTNAPSSPEIKVQLPGTPGFGAGQNLVRQDMHTPDEKTQEDDLAELRLKTLPNPHASVAN
ncbi:hypothetical protein EST38_g12022 [Candolleomyces aberdarensis]|uniref:Uncharacterized protein n=1 Tax=Candolleomyces aberdarensis TaxID=2316362 RepID=A0A4Q2D442_9AGAR|nr:hypothetical protein EST38_g12022 [Candolleomyces aberdarensis]